MNELIDALRYCAKREICTSETSAECPFTNKWTDGVDCMNALFCDAADAIERLVAERDQWKSAWQTANKLYEESKRKEYEPIRPN